MRKPTGDYAATMFFFNFWAIVYDDFTTLEPTSFCNNLQQNSIQFFIFYQISQQMFKNNDFIRSLSSF